MSEILAAEGIEKQYQARKVLDVERVSIREGEILSCLGPSGAGKSVLMRLLNLLEPPSAGKIYFRGLEVQNLKGRERVRVARKMSMLFQDPLLFSADVEYNVAYGLKIRKVPRSEIEARVAASISMVRMEGFERKHIFTLSGGEAQRVALARALVVEPELVLLDEPFASLDRINREALQVEVKRILKENGYSAVFVTHDQEEAARMGDRIAVMESGRIVHVGAPEDIFYRPASEFVARFVGMDNLFGGTVASAADGIIAVSVKGGVIEVVSGERAGREVTVGVRPEDVTILPESALGIPASSRNAFGGIVSGIELAGATARVRVECPFQVCAVITRRSLAELGISVGSRVVVRFKATAAHVIGGTASVPGGDD